MADLMALCSNGFSWTLSDNGGHESGPRFLEAAIPGLDRDGGG